MWTGRKRSTHGAYFGNLEIVNLLIENGADINIQNQEKETSTDHVIHPWDGHTQLNYQGVQSTLKVKLDLGKVKAAGPKMKACCANMAAKPLPTPTVNRIGEIERCRAGKATKVLDQCEGLVGSHQGLPHWKENYGGPSPSLEFHS